MDETPRIDAALTFGEYMRRLRRARPVPMSLLQLADKTGISYSHLSRIENDSTVPGPDTVAKLADALGGDLKTMLLKADCLPRVILDRMVANDSDRDSVKMLRAANAAGADDEGDEHLVPLVGAIEEQLNVPGDEAWELASALEALASLSADRRTMVISFVHSLRSEAGGRSK